jgi:4-amino-4-deoxy-L-arabinose transferase-like glycosyltransferase
MNMNKKVVLFLLLLYFISRFFFINSQDVFFDSGEYLNLFALPNIVGALLDGHFPPHEGYIILFWPIFQLAKLLNLNPGFSVIVGQIFLSVITLYCFYEFILFISDKRIALGSTIIASLTPLFWIVNDTIMMENAYICFFFLSLFFLTKYITHKKRTYNLHISLFFLSFTFLTQPLTLIWVPFLFFIVYYKNNKILLQYVIWTCAYIGVAILLNSTFVSYFTHNSWLSSLHHLYGDKSQEFEYFQWNINGILVFGRDFIIPLMRNNTSLVVILAGVALIPLFKKNRKLFFLSILWVAPAIYANQWWDSLLMGRHSLISDFGLAFLVAWLVRKNNIYTTLVICYLLFVTLPAIFLLRNNIPYLREEAFVKTLPKNSVFIEGHFALPQVKENKGYIILEVNTPSMSNAVLERDINYYLKMKKPIYISSAALSDPYGLYSGPYLHNLSLSYAHGFQLDPLLTNYTLKQYKIISQKDNLIIYKIVSNKKSTYPYVPDMINSYRRIDYYDPLWWGYRLLTAFLPQKP